MPGQSLIVGCCLDGQMRPDFPFFPSFDERGTKLAGDVRLLAEGADANAKSPYGATGLFFAAELVARRGPGAARVRARKTSYAATITACERLSDGWSGWDGMSARRPHSSSSASVHCGR